MKKLSLNLEDLHLQSFHLDDADGAARGTVLGAESTATDGCPGSYPYHCPPVLTRGCA